MFSLVLGVLVSSKGYCLIFSEYWMLDDKVGHSFSSSEPFYHERHTHWDSQNISEEDKFVLRKF